MKKHLLLVLLLLGSYCGRAQYLSGDTLLVNSYEEYLDIAFGQLDLSPVTSGLLLDRSPNMAQAMPYTGASADSVGNFVTWQLVYAVSHLGGTVRITNGHFDIKYRY